MSLTLVVEDGTGLESANSYATVAEGDAYAEGRLNSDTWFAAPSARRAIALVTATRYIDQQFQFFGFKVSQTQALQWPRRQCPDPDSDQRSVGLIGGEGPFVDETSVPKAVKDACCEAAVKMLEGDPSEPAPGEGLKSFEIPGAIKLEFDKGTAAEPLTREVLRALSKLGDPIGATSGTAKLIRV